MHATLQEQLRAVMAKWEEGEEAAQAPAPAPAQPTQATQPTPSAKPQQGNHLFNVTSNLNRNAFQQIKEQPGTRKQVSDALIARGYKLGSVSAIIGQMLRQGIAQADDEGVLHVTVPEYVPLKHYKTLQKKTASQPVVGVRKKVIVNVRKKTTQVEEEKRPMSSAVGGIAALSPVPTPAPVPTPFNAERAAQQVLETLTVLQAKALYNELKKIFGDAK